VTQSGATCAERDRTSSSTLGVSVTQSEV
jgi:hypothetical protein